MTGYAKVSGPQMTLGEVLPSVLHSLVQDRAVVFSFVMIRALLQDRQFGKLLMISL
jgi:hypothetical protein